MVFFAQGYQNMTNHSNCSHLVFCAILLFFSCSLIFAQPPGGRQRGQGGPGMPPGGGQRPGGQFGQGGQGRPMGQPGQFGQGQRPGGRPGQPEQPAENVENQEPEMVTGPGTVPEIWDDNPQEEFEVRSLADRAVIARPMSTKLLRYTEHLIRKYDTNGNGRLEFEEWHGKIPDGQIIDLNGDGIITLDEIASYTERFSRWRTIHNPYPLRQLTENRVLPEQIKIDGIFRPLSLPPTVRKISDTQNVADRPSLTEDELAEVVHTPEDTASENEDQDKNVEPFQGDVPAAQIKKYAAPTEGLPAWFIQRDTNGDGQVSLYEFCAPNFRDQDLALFGRLDLNGDGFITPEELPQQQ